GDTCARRRAGPCSQRTADFNDAGSRRCQSRGHIHSREIEMSNPEGVDRRSFFKVAGVAGGGAVVRPRRRARTKRERARRTPEEIIQIMKNGNERFRNGQVSTQDYLAQQRASAKG